MGEGENGRGIKSLRGNSQLCKTGERRNTSQEKKEKTAFCGDPQMVDKIRKSTKIGGQVRGMNDYLRYELQVVGKEKKQGASGAA